MYILFHKPFGVLCQFKGEVSDRTLSEFSLPPKVYPAGRLDKDSEGLLILSDDGKFIQKITDPSFKKDKYYLVQVEGVPRECDLLKMRKGLTIQNYKTLPCKVRLIKDPELFEREKPIRFRKKIPTSWIEVILNEGKNRQVRKMTAHIGYPTLRLFRSQIAKAKIGNLAPGEWREVRREDIL